MANKVRVYGKAQNRTVLGIVHAYMVMYPHATLDDLRKAFPNDLNPDMGVKELFLPVEQAEKFNTKMSLYFAKDDEVLATGDGTKVALSQVWSKPSFERIVAHGKGYDIEVAEFEKTAHPGQRGGYRLEYLNGYVPPVPESRSKGLPRWAWLILALLVAGIAVALLLPRGEKVVEVEKIVEKEVVVRDTVYVQQIQDIETAFNAARFEQGAADLNDDAKLALHDLAKVMKQNESLRLRIEGHTSVEGDDDANLALSERRARAAVDFLTGKEGIDPSRLEAVGKGSSQPIDPDNLEANRRTEFVIIK
ncbi:MAG: OmpA family protein [Bacteroides sp.]|nr:OmpA family protein [Bacteroides sp.]MCM1094912.1 OmpA family protein [Terasakiella sp.]